MAAKNGPASNSAEVHITLQGKGGVGKSFVSMILAQYFASKGRQLECFDTDPVNSTFAGFKALPVHRLDVMNRGSVDPKRFDELIGAVCAHEGTFVIDTGATTFLALWQYIVESEIFTLLANQGRRVFVHSVLTGGQALADTVSGFASVAKTSTDRNVVVWLNEYFGLVEREGKPFREMKAFTENESKVCGQVTILQRNPATYGDDVKLMLERRLTFTEAIGNGDFGLVSKQRLQIVQRDLYEQLDKLALQ